MEGMKISIQSNIIMIEENIEKALKKSGREGEKVELIAVTKTIDIDRINETIRVGISNIGENKVQELEKKYDLIGDTVNYHMIGHLQTNKVKNIIGKTRLIHSLDRLSLAKELDKRSKNSDIITDVLVQVNVAEEESKFGLKVEEVLYFIEEILDLKNIKVRGLMTIAPNTTDEILLRKVFRTLYNLKENIINKNYENLSMDYLSMGMTNDYELAIEEGSNMIRVGSAIFGKRNY
ncbi:MAG: Pyridoxal phosphate homeostasis protein [Tissierella sp.]|jgi:pyridoxal phosphate enzyme (YggS family)